MTEQAPRTVLVLTATDTSVPRPPRMPAQDGTGRYIVAGISYHFIQVKPERFFGIEKVWIGDAQVPITDPERTLLDGLSMPQYCGDFAEVLHAFEVRGSQLNLTKIIEYALRFDAATAKRLGWVLTRQGIEPSQLQPLLDITVKGFRKLD